MARTKIATGIRSEKVQREDRRRRRSTLTRFSWWPEGGEVFKLCLETGYEIGQVRRVDAEWVATCFGQHKLFRGSLGEQAVKSQTLKWARSLVESMVESELLPDATRTEVTFPRPRIV
jgi:hypothetical protein